MITSNIDAIMCANMTLQNTLRMQRNRREEEEREQRRVKAASKSSFNKDKQKER